MSSERMAVSAGAAPAPAAWPGRAGEDWELVQAARGGDAGAFHALMRRHEAAIYRTALAILRLPADAEDVCQETFLRAFEHLESFRGEARFATWLTQICVNTARMKLRKNHADLWRSLDEPLATEEGEVALDPAEWRENPEQQYNREERERLLLHALGGLHPSYREVVVLRDLRQFSTEETARTLGLTEANVKTRLLRARLQLRQRLTPHFKRRAEAD